MDSSINRSLSPPTPFPTLETITTPLPTTNLPSRTRSRSDTLRSSTERPQLEDLIPASRRDSINSNTSDSSLLNAELERLRAEVIRHDRELQDSGIGLGIYGEEIAAETESEEFSYRGVQSARPSPRLPSVRQPIPVVEHPLTTDLRARRRGSVIHHSRSSSVSSLPSTEDLRAFPELDYRPIVQEPFHNQIALTSSTYNLPQLTSATYVPPPQPPKTRKDRKMNYQGFGDPNQSGQPSNSRQAPPSPGQGMAHTNGMNGQMNMAGMANMIGFPTPAGHQSDLNYIMVMVEELSRLLAANQKITDSILEKIGNVPGSENLEIENAQLRREVESSKADADENWKLVLHAAGILEDIKEKAHNYKFQHEKDTLAWHKSYRDQLAQERKENLELRCHIADMQAHAAKANDYINQLRRYASENKIITELTTQVHQYKGERRYWKRMACPGLIEDPSEWSDGEGGATGDIPEAEKIACAPWIAEREEMARILNGDGGSS
ncbi:uncharacterized protein EAF02_005635 [Botrytis sinoallii]|uniref:uncharacterized protein n=1 Tax=Botrytis sinoallii TaxID=1463999 RepID=UPI0018FF545B|nr:uncharacterized protein EAF02_005635 [Botrytis sinoallii]KAF7883715.1 hypothetical protein EAF02_005635 [Botrytis sinoallii]